MGSKVVLSLVHPLLGKGYTVNMDNFFSSPALYDLLCRHQTDAVETLRSNCKGVPKELSGKKLKKGDIYAMYSRKLMVLRWRDKKDAYMLSTYHDHNTVYVPPRRGQDGINKSEVYNDKMGGVDLSDAFLVCYPTARKRMKKYYQKQFRHILDMAALKAFILYRKNGGTKSRLQFQLSLIDRLITTNRGEVPE
jgi:hypothetical protein